MIDRIMRVIKLDFPVFKEIEADPNATSEAAIIVVVVTLISALGSGMAMPHRFFAAFVSEILSGVVGWVVWAAVVYFLGKSMFAGKGTLEGLLRVLGYASAPRLLGILAVIPCVGWLGTLAGVILSLIMGFMAIREGLDLDTTQALIVTVVGWIALVIVSIFFAIVFGGMAAIFRSVAGPR